MNRKQERRPRGSRRFRVRRVRRWLNANGYNPNKAELYVKWGQHPKYIIRNGLARYIAQNKTEGG